MFFTFGAEKKAERALKYAEEKIAEAKAMAEKNKAEATERANRKYEEFLGLANQKAKGAKEKGKDVEELITLIIVEMLRRQEVLTEVLKKVPEQDKSGIEGAIEVSKKGFEEAIKAAGPEKFIRETILRMDGGDFQSRLDQAVDEYGKKFTPGEIFTSERVEEMKAMRKKALGEKGENIKNLSAQWNKKSPKF